MYTRRACVESVTRGEGAGCNPLGCGDSFSPNGAARGQNREVESLLGPKVPVGNPSLQEHQLLKRGPEASSPIGARRLAFLPPSHILPPLPNPHHHHQGGLQKAVVCKVSAGIFQQRNESICKAACLPIPGKSSPYLGDTRCCSPVSLSHPHLNTDPGNRESMAMAETAGKRNHPAAVGVLTGHLGALLF